LNIISENNVQSFADAGSSNITRLPILMSMVCQVFVFWIREGDRDKRRKERSENVIILN